MNVSSSIIRYSPKSLSEYVDGVSSGPSKDRRVDMPEIWNLAYLTHPYEKSLMPNDPHLLTHVRRTCQFNLVSHKVDLAWTDPDELFLNLLRKPAPWVVRWLQKNPEILMKLPLYEAYGADWFATIAKRSRMCGDHDHEPVAEIKDFSDARKVIARAQAC